MHGCIEVPPLEGLYCSRCGRAERARQELPETIIAKRLSDAGLSGYTAKRLSDAGYNRSELETFGYSDREITAVELRMDTKPISLDIDRDDDGLNVSFVNLAGNQVCQPHKFGNASKVEELLDYMRHGLSCCSGIVLYDRDRRVLEHEDIASYNGLTAARIQKTPAQMKSDGYSARELREAGCTVTELRLARYSGKEVGAAGYDDEELKVGKLGMYRPSNHNVGNGPMSLESLMQSDGVQVGSRRKGDERACWSCCCTHVHSFSNMFGHYVTLGCELDKACLCPS